MTKNEQLDVENKSAQEELKQELFALGDISPASWGVLEKLIYNTALQLEIDHALEMERMASQERAAELDRIREIVASELEAGTPAGRERSGKGDDDER